MPTTESRTALSAALDKLTTDLSALPGVSQVSVETGYHGVTVTARIQPEDGLYVGALLAAFREEYGAAMLVRIPLVLDGPVV